MAKNITPCECSQFTAYDIDNDVEYRTHCTSQTARTFAPGHDAKLKGNLIRWAVLGYEIRRGDVTKSAEGWAEGFGFGYQVRSGIRRSAERAQAKADKRLAKTRTAPAPTIVKAKVGRWVYEGFVSGTEFVYLNKQNETVRAAKFTVQD